MIRNRNGYWMSKKFFHDGEGGVAGAATPGAAGEGVPGGDDGANGAGNGSADAGEGGEGGSDSKDDAKGVDALNAEIARLKAEAARQKAALDTFPGRSGRAADLLPCRHKEAWEGKHREDGDGQTRN